MENIISEMKKPPEIYLDESGNTGSQLLEASQPIFVLASSCFTEQEALLLLRVIDSKSPHEVHFKTLRRRKSGQDAILRMLQHPLINDKKINASVFHKRYMIVTKIVDLLIEYKADLDGFDLYENGFNIALSNMIYFCTPVFCGVEKFEVFLASFVIMIRDQSDDNINLFYNNAVALFNGCKDLKFKSILYKVIDTRIVIKKALATIEKSALDPAIPAFFSACVYWGKKYPSGFNAIHDDAQPVEAQKELFDKFMDFTKEQVTVGYDRRKFDLPLKCLDFTFASSLSTPQLQVSDIIASSICYLMKVIDSGNQDDYFFQELEKANIKRFISDIVWPSLAVTPTDLDTNDNTGNNPADNSAIFLMQPSK